MLDKTVRFRLIGVIILVIVSAAVLPIILDGERPPELDVTIQIEAAPSIPSVKVAPLQPITSLGINDDSDSEIEPSSSADEPTTNVSTSSVKKEEHSKQSDDGIFKPQVTVKATNTIRSNEQSSTPKSVAPTASKEPRWSVQIATFKSKNNAENLVKKLIKADYAAYSITTNSLYKVYVGPEIKREKAEQFRDQIKKDIGLKGLIVKYSEN
ncbi:SPOR domain-containing protein [Marinomonas algicola]|jgi:DedD protein|uniref:SPOR domain-containing protein n=1 Tax=Marinomonas algicola TaxID=2773454 RepID=UPI00174AFA1F|nr:SPOR domain-containing protein [Marinomonas algicola]